jgi:hypothetical protein
MRASHNRSANAGRAMVSARLGLVALILFGLAACDSFSGVTENPVKLKSGSGTGERCEEQVLAELARLGVPAGEIEYISYVAQKQGGRTPYRRDSGAVTSAYDAWLKPSGVKGHIIMSLAPSCAVQQVYTEGAYELRGVPRY